MATAESTSVVEVGLRLASPGLFRVWFVPADAADAALFARPCHIYVR